MEFCRKGQNELHGVMEEIFSCEQVRSALYDSVEKWRKGTRKLTSPVFCTNEMQRPDPREQKMQLEQQVCKGHQDTQKKLKEASCCLQLPSQYTNLVQGQTSKETSVWIHLWPCTFNLPTRLRGLDSTAQCSQEQLQQRHWETCHVRGNAGADKYSPSVVGPAGREVPNDRITTMEGPARSTCKEGTV